MRRVRLTLDRPTRDGDGIIEVLTNLSAEVATAWVEISGWSVGQMAEWLKGLARSANLRRYRKAVRGPKKPKPPRTRFPDAKHVATSRLLNGEQT